MKPRTKREREVVELSSMLPPIKEATEWAKHNIFVHEAYRCKDELYCSDCGQTWIDTSRSELSDIVLDNKTICPYCHSELAIKVSSRKKNDETIYMTMAQVIGKYQVIRHVQCNRFTRKERAYLHYFFTEVVQEWITEDGKRTIMAKPFNTNRTGFLYSRDLSIKNEFGSYWGYIDNCYALCGELYPNIQILPILRQRGLKKTFCDCTPSVIIIGLLKGYNDYEYLIKTKQTDILHHLIRKGSYQLRYKHVINICNRNNYKVKDASLYFDYIDLLNHFNLDTHNAHYVCPNNLAAEHDKLLKRKDRLEAANRLQSQKQEAKKYEKNYIKQKSKFFSICITDGIISISPLKSVYEFIEEGNEMHHCVFTNKYYTKKDALILSATIDGKRIETIEINLRTFEVVQSRSVCNKNSEYHDQILKLVRSSIN